MLNEGKQWSITLQNRMQELGINHAVFTSDSSIAYLAGFWGFWHRVWPPFHAFGARGGRSDCDHTLDGKQKGRGNDLGGGHTPPGRCRAKQLGTRAECVFA